MKVSGGERKVMSIPQFYVPLSCIDLCFKVIMVNTKYTLDDYAQALSLLNTDSKIVFLKFKSLGLQAHRNLLGVIDLGKDIPVTDTNFVSSFKALPHMQQRHLIFCFYFHIEKGVFEEVTNINIQEKSLQRSLQEAPINTAT
jgi:hypothetical protein